MNKFLNQCYKIGIIAKIYQLPRHRCLWEYTSEKISENNYVPKRRQCQNVTTQKSSIYFKASATHITMNCNRETIAIVDCQHERMQKNYCSLRARHRGFNKTQVGIFVSIRLRIRVRGRFHNAIKNNHVPENHLKEKLQDLFTCRTHIERHVWYKVTK